MDFPIFEVRACFPSLEVTDDGRRRIYLDNPAGTQVPRQVVDAVSRIYLEHNSYTGVFDSYSVEIDELVRLAYHAMAEFLGSDDSGEIIIGPSTTALTYRLTRIIAHLFAPGDEIIVTKMDHEANISPWLQLAEDRGATVRWLPFNRDSWRLEPEDLASVLTERTKLLAFNYVSNLTGVINDAPALTRLAKSAGALVFIDGVQFVPHYGVEAPEIGCDFFACSPYKFFGPHLGTLWGRRSLLERGRAYKTRTASDDLPQRFIVGIPPFELLSGLLGMIGYFETLGRLVGGRGGRRSLIEAAFRRAETHERLLSKRLVDGMETIPGLRPVGPRGPSTDGTRAPIFSFTHAAGGLGPLVRALANDGIFCHWGRKFANEAANFISAGTSDGFLRLGVSHYNTPEEIDRLVACLHEATRGYRDKSG